MNTKSEYYQYTKEPSIVAMAEKEAARFTAEETQFQLGHIPTEQPHPYTQNFSCNAQEDPAAGCAVLLQVDKDLPPVVRRTFLSKPFQLLVEALEAVIKDNKRVCFSGCGSTGRLSMILEEMWRRHWEDLADAEIGRASRNSDPENEYLIKADLACSIMTGGDRALIRAVENFEDYADFGARQTADMDLTEGDVFIAISEGGETSSVIGTADEALRRGCRVSFVFNNPAAVLEQTVERSKRIINNPLVNVIDLYSGPMALTGSTRLQATTIEMAVIGAAMEEAFLSARGIGTSVQDRISKADLLASLINELCSNSNLEVLGRLSAKEASIYSQGGRLTYLASSFLLDIFSDTTERSPTFMLPPFRPGDDHTAAVSWAYAKDPGRLSEEAWFSMLRRSPRGIDWDSEDYLQMNASQNLVDNPPSLGSSEISRYLIGCDEDPSRTEVEPFYFLQIMVGVSPVPADPDIPTLYIGSPKLSENSKKTDDYFIDIDLPESPVFLWHHIAVKLIMNTMSTVSMGIMGRIRGNWMVQLDPTNKKLVDRGSRIIAHLTGLSYTEACVELQKSIYARDALLKAGGKTTTSPVVDALDRISANKE